MVTPTLTFEPEYSAAVRASGSSLVAQPQVTTTIGPTEHLAVVFTCDPAAGVVSVAATAASGVEIDPFTILYDVQRGSGTSGVRQVYAYAKVRGTAGALVDVTVTHPTLTSRAMQVFRVGGADENGVTAATANLSDHGPVTVTVPAEFGYSDFSAHYTSSVESNSATVAPVSIPAPWVYRTATIQTGTSGGGNANTHVMQSVIVLDAIAAAATNYTFALSTSDPDGLGNIALWRSYVPTVAPNVVNQEASNRFGDSFIRVFWRDDASPGATYVVERSSDGITWNAVPGTTYKLGGGAWPALGPQSGNHVNYLWHDDVDAAALAGGFLYRISGTSPLGTTSVTTGLSEPIKPFPRFNNFEHLADGTVVTVYNSGSAVDTALDHHGGGAIADVDTAALGSASVYTESSLTGRTGSLGHRFGLSTAQAFGRSYHRFDNFPDGLRVRFLTVSSQLGAIVDNVLLGVDSVGMFSYLENNQLVADNIAGPVALGQWFRVEMSLPADAPPIVRFYFDPASEVPDVEFSPATSNPTNVRNTYWQFHSGNHSAGETPLRWHMDGLALSRDGWIGPEAAITTADSVGILMG